MTNIYSPTWFELFMRPIQPVQTDTEIAFVTSYLPLPAYRSVLDLCCGWGHHAGPRLKACLGASGAIVLLLSEVRPSNPWHDRRHASPQLTRQVEDEHVESVDGDDVRRRADIVEAVLVVPRCNASIKARRSSISAMRSCGLRASAESIRLRSTPIPLTRGAAWPDRWATDSACHPSVHHPSQQYVCPSLYGLTHAPGTLPSCPRR